MTEGAALTDAAARLAAAGIEEPRREARLLLGLALKRGIEALLLSADRPLAGEDAARFAALIARRVRHEPYARIAGKREFWSRDFLLSPETLDPRPDSETVIEAALALIPDRAAPLEIVDFGTGSGALLLALLTELPNASGLGIDIAPGALVTARRNAAALGLAARTRFAGGNWGAALKRPADVILANPPYIPSADLGGLAPEIVDFDPRRALDGGADGLQAYRDMAPDMARLLKKSGIALCEIGAGQSTAIVEIMSRVRLELVAKRCDLGGLERCLVFALRKD